MHAFLIKYKQNKWDKAINRYMESHPRIATLILFVAMPIFILAGVFACTATVIIPLSWLLGWL